MKTGDLVQYKPNAFMGASPKSYGTGVVLCINDPTVDRDTGEVWSNKVINVMWASGSTTWDTKCSLEVISESR